MYNLFHASDCNQWGFFPKRNPVSGPRNEDARWCEVDLSSAELRGRRVIYLTSIGLLVTIWSTQHSPCSMNIRVSDLGNPQLIVPPGHHLLWLQTVLDQQAAPAPIE